MSQKKRKKCVSWQEAILAHLLTAFAKRTEKE